MAKKSNQQEPKRQRKTNAEYVRAHMAKAACIGPIRAVVNPVRRERCRLNLRLFLETYLAECFPWPFSQDHLDLIASIEEVVLRGGRFLTLVYRGFGKSTIFEGAVLWAAVYGHRNFVPLISTVKSTAEKSMKSIRSELESNPTLAEDFPGVCQPIEALEGISQRAAAQTYTTASGATEHTHIEWRQEEIVLPQIEGSASAGVILTVYGIESRKARGLRYKRRDGSMIRPDLVLIDDPQDGKIARNPQRVDALLTRIKSDIIMSGGHAKKLACLIAATVIAPSDAVDRLSGDASWVSRRVKMLKKRAKNESLWLVEYANIRRSYEPGNAEDKARAEKEANEYYLKHKAEMDEGAVIAWEQCYNESETSAMQHAYNILIDYGEETFASECQNEPIDPTVNKDEQFTMADVRAKLTRLPRGVVPAACARVTAFIDVADRELQWTVCAWGDGYAGSVLDYGIHKIRQRKGGDKSQTIISALAELEPRISGKLWQQDGAGQLKTSRTLIDSGNGNYSEAIYAFVKNKHAVMASRGFFVKPDYCFVKKGTAQINQYMGGRIYIAPPPEGKTQVPLVHFDANEMKSFVWHRLMTGMGGAGCLAFFGTDAEALRVLWEHTQSEFKATMKSMRTNKVYDHWQQKPGNPPNHFWDGLVGCAVGAALERIPTIAELEARKLAKHINRNPDMAAAAAGAISSMRRGNYPANQNSGGIRRNY